MYFDVEFIFGLFFDVFNEIDIDDLIFIDFEKIIGIN